MGSVVSNLLVAKRDITPMFESWLDHINVFLHTHAEWMSRLAFLFRLKVNLLTLLASYFLFRLYREQHTKRSIKKKLPTSSGHFLA